MNGSDLVILPHGEKLINKVVDAPRKQKLLEKAKKMKSLVINKRTLSDLELLAVGGYSPLEGFMTQDDYLNVLKNLRLTCGLVWSIPITLSISKENVMDFSVGEDIALKGTNNEIYGVLHLTQKYLYDPEYEAKCVYGTLDQNHPGVHLTLNKGYYNLAGPITLLKRAYEPYFQEYVHDPIHTRGRFQENGWESIVAFQTRNPIHRAHEFIQKSALEQVDGLFIHPLVGDTKQDDIPADIRFKSYQVLLENYFPKQNVMLSTFPASMRYAGPREAIFHALIRKNYGCSHFIVGRDHAGVGDYYGTYDAQDIFNRFKKEEIGIEILKFEHAFYCEICDQMATSKTCPHDKSRHLYLSGTKVREMLRDGQIPPKEFTRPEVAKALVDGLKKHG